MALFDRNRFCALVSAFMVSAVLAGCGSGGGGGGGITPDGPSGAMRTFTTGTPTPLDLTGTAENDVWMITGDATGTALTIDGVIDGAGGNDRIELNAAGAVVASVSFSDQAPTANSGALHLQNVETITIDGGTVNGDVDTSAATAGITFNLTSGTIGGDVTGTSMADSFVIGAGITIDGTIDGGLGMDTLSLATGFTPASANLTGGVLTLTLTGGGFLTLTLVSIDMFDIATTDTLGLTMNANTPRPLTGTPSPAQLTGDGGDDVFMITDDTDGGNRTLTINGVINGAGGQDEFQLSGGFARIASIAFSNTPPTGGSGVINLQSIEIITINGGAISGAIDTSAASAGVTFNLMAGSIGLDEEDGVGRITGSDHDDTFNIAGAITGDNVPLSINGVIDGAVGQDEIQLAVGALVTNIAFSNTAPTLAQTGALHLQNIETITLNGGRVTGTIDASGETTAAITFNLVSGRADGNIIGSPQNDTFIVSGNVGNAELDVNGLIQGGGGDQDEVRLVAGGIVVRIDFDSFIAGQLNLRTVETITIDGGRVNGSVDATDAPAGITFNLISGTISATVSGSGHNDIINLHPDININNGLLGGGAGEDVLRYAGAVASTADVIPFLARNGLAEDPDITDEAGSVFQIESQEPLPPDAGSVGAGLRGLTVRGIEVLNLSPALNLYGAMSDALMQFGAQTAQGFALADLNLATGRATSLVSKDSPFTKGRIWAHKITHSGNGKGSIGLGLTGLTARADSDYDYEMSLTQHGFDAPLATTRLGAFNLRAVSHTMTGTIETNVAQAQVSGYGAGVALLWNSGAVARQRAKRARAPIISAVSASAHHGLSAHITSLAGAYEVEAHTSPLNPRAVVSEITEGSFSAINAVVSAGVADTRKLGHSLVLRTTADLVWQTLSLDDFSETGPDGIAINFDKATRFTARVGAGLESEHWFSDVAFVHETSSGGTLSSGLRQDYKQDDGTAIEMKLGGKLADLATGLTLKAYAGLRTSLTRSDAIDPSAHLALNWRF